MDSKKFACRSVNVATFIDANHILTNYLTECLTELQMLMVLVSPPLYVFSLFHRCYWCPLWLNFCILRQAHILHFAASFSQIVQTKTAVHTFLVCCSLLACLKFNSVVCFTCGVWKFRNFICFNLVNVELISFIVCLSTLGIWTCVFLWFMLSADCTLKTILSHSLCKQVFGKDRYVKCKLYFLVLIT